MHGNGKEMHRPIFMYTNIPSLSVRYCRLNADNIGDSGVHAHVQLRNRGRIGHVTARRSRSASRELVSWLAVRCSLDAGVCTSGAVKFRSAAAWRTTDIPIVRRVTTRRSKVCRASLECGTLSGTGTGSGSTNAGRCRACGDADDRVCCVASFTNDSIQKRFLFISS